MATIQTEFQFNIRKKQLNSSKLNAGKENADYWNKRSSAMNAYVERGRKCYENKHKAECEDSLSSPYLLSDGGSDSDSDIECVLVKECGSKAGGNKASLRTKRQVGNADNGSMGLFISLYCILRLPTLLYF
jgi:hypothetical protein